MGCVQPDLKIIVVKGQTETGRETIYFASKWLEICIDYMIVSAKADIHIL